MTERELRALVREAIARTLDGDVPRRGLEPGTVARGHASHLVFTLPSGGDLDGPCVIEPSVRCNHCGFCRSYGH